MGNNLENIKIGDTVVFTIGNWHQSTIIDKVDEMEKIVGVIKNKI